MTFALGTRRLRGKYSDYAIKIEKAYIDASRREALNKNLIEDIINKLPNGTSQIKNVTVSAPGYLGAGFIAHVMRWQNKPICARWVQYIWRNYKRPGIYDKTPHRELDYAFPAGHPYASDFAGYAPFGLSDSSLEQRFELYLVHSSTSEVMHTIYWSNTHLS